MRFTTTKVILFSYTNYPSLISNLEKEGVKMSQDDLLRHGSFTFDLQGVSRAASHQIVRHRIASFSQQSQRYVKITRSYGYLKPSGIPEDLKVPVEIHGRKMELSFADVMDLTRQAEEGLVAKGIKAEDSRSADPLLQPPMRPGRPVGDPRRGMVNVRRGKPRRPQSLRSPPRRRGERVCQETGHADKRARTETGRRLREDSSRRALPP